ncbi:MAG TPA: dihydroxyacetone kinase subunit DhaL, partial [Atopostipes sp.]|nr:dihydroxyacetone kinase subunit DhaL [Atopostipes sp.]
MTHVIIAIEDQKPEKLNELLKLVTTNLLSKVGGASGPLYGSAFMGMMKAEAAGEDWATILKVALENIQMRGKAEQGDKTMVDLWIAVVEAIENDQLTHEVIDEAVEATKPLKAKKGRASYVGDRSIGHIDPGAYSSGLLFHAMLEAEAE